MQIAIYSSSHGKPGIIAQRVELSLEQLGQVLQAQVDRHHCQPVGKMCQSKTAGLAWAPHEIPDGTRRSNESVTGLSALVYDLDGLPEAEIIALGERLAAKGLAYYLHSTHAHAPPDSYSARLVLPLAEPFARAEGESGDRFKARWREFWEATAAELGIASAKDDAAKDPARLYYFPSLPDDGPEFLWAEQKGSAIKLPGSIPGPVAGAGGVEASHPEESPSSSGVISPSSSGSPAAPSLEEVAKRLKTSGDNAARTQTKAWLAGAPLAPQGQQDPTAQSLAWKIARVVPESTDEQILILFGPCLHATQWDGPDDIRAWFRAKLERARLGVAAKRAEEEAAAARQRQALGLAPALAPAEGLKPPLPLVEGEGDAEPDWLLRLQQQGFRASKDGEPLRFKPSGHVVAEMLRHAQQWRGVFRKNLLTSQVEAHGGPIDLPTNNFDATVTAVTNWFESELGMHGLRESIVYAQINRVAEETAFDPVVEYLDGLRWDGVARVERLFTDYVPTEAVNDAGQDLRGFNAQVARRWMVSAVARGRVPGCKADSMLLFTGFGGRKKSQFGEILGGEWQTTYGHADLGTKDSKKKLASNWIVEIEELVAFDSRSKEAIKKDISERMAQVRPPYGRAEREYRRRCVFFGTTNEDDCIPEDTGGYRRFWVIRVVADMVPAKLRADRDQLWAEADAIYKAAETCAACRLPERCPEHRWWFERDEAFPVDEIIESHVSADPLATRIEDWFAQKLPASRPKQIRTIDLMAGLGFDAREMNRSLEVRMGRALKKLGFRRFRQLTPPRQYLYTTPEALLGAAQKTGSGPRLTETPARV